jgi:hypothetical protein
MACDIWTGLIWLGIGNTDASCDDSDKPAGSIKGGEFLY